MLIIDKILELLTDNTRGLIQKLLFSGFLLLAAYLINDHIGFTHNYRLEHKIEQAQGIAQMLDNESVPPSTKKELAIMLEESLHRKSLLERMPDAFSYQGEPIVKLPENGFMLSLFQRRSGVLYLFSTSGFTIAIIGFLLLFSLFGYLEGPLPVRITQCIVVVMIGFPIVLLQCLFPLFLLPQQIFGSWGWNYLAYFLIQTGFYSILYAILYYSKDPENPTRTYKLVLLKTVRREKEAA